VPQPKLSEFRSRSSGACEHRLPPPMPPTDLEASGKHHVEGKHCQIAFGSRVAHPKLAGKFQPYLTLQRGDEGVGKGSTPRADRVLSQSGQWLRSCN